MINLMNLVTMQYIGLAVLVVLAVSLTVILVFVGKKRKLGSNVECKGKKVMSINLDIDEEDEANGINLLAKRTYLVGELNKVRPQVYSVLNAENVTILVNQVKVNCSCGDKIELKEGDTISSISDNVLIA